MLLICDISNKNCQQLYLRNVSLFWGDNPFRTACQPPTGSSVVTSNRETMWRGIWICQSQVPAFFYEHKLSAVCSLGSDLSTFIYPSLLISGFKKSGKVISSESRVIFECSLWPMSVFCSACLSFYPEKSPQNGVEIHLKSLALHNRSHYIVYPGPPVVLITLLQSRFWNARLFFAHCRISCRGIMEVGMGRPLPINILHSTRQVICQILKVHNDETPGHGLLSPPHRVSTFWEARL